jgi:pimeloyl-ACP methyl ester carboxylesterase
MSRSTPQSERLLAAERQLFAAHGIPHEHDEHRLRDPDLTVAVRVLGDGEPLVLVHGSGMCAATWAPLLPHLSGRRLIAVDLPGFGLSDPCSYRGRPLRAHAVVQLTSLLDALGLERAELVGTSLGAMWALCLALDAPKRVERVTALGVPAVCLPGMQSETFFRLMTTPGLGRLVARAPAPSSPAKVRKAITPALGAPAAQGQPDAFFAVVGAAMAMPGWSEAMWTHLNLAMRFGRQRPENVFGDDELRRIEAPVRFIWGTDDVYGPPSIGERAASLMPDARVDVIPGAGHAPFLDDPEACARLVLSTPPSTAHRGAS